MNITETITETTTVDLMGHCRHLDAIHAEIYDQVDALSAMVEIIHGEDVHSGLSTILRSIRENISEQLEQLTEADTRLRNAIGWKEVQP